MLQDFVNVALETKLADNLFS